jgi:hypothetical protein
MKKMKQDHKNCLKLEMHGGQEKRGYGAGKARNFEL